MCLAKLGHALHQVEDFFAHSNWIELAVQRRGPRYADKFLPPKASPAFINRSRSVIEIRLVRHLTVQLPNWRDHDPERWVVTGYFDIRDTIISLLHLSDQTWGGHVPDPFAFADKALQKAKDAREKPSIVVAAPDGCWQRFWTS